MVVTRHTVRWLTPDGWSSTVNEDLTRLRLCFTNLPRLALLLCLMWCTREPNPQEPTLVHAEACLVPFPTRRTRVR